MMRLGIFCTFTGHWDFLFPEMPIQVFAHIQLFLNFLIDLEDSLGIPYFNPLSIMYVEISCLFHLFCSHEMNILISESY